MTLQGSACPDSWPASCCPVPQGTFYRAKLFPSVERALFAKRLVTLGCRLKKDGYFFRTGTPATHARVLSRAQQGADTLRETFGWNRPVTALPDAYQTMLDDPELFDRQSGRAKIRFSNLGPLLLAHSGYPTTQGDAVFFGPDTYRFAHGIQALRDREPDFAPRICLDIGAGTGAGGLFCGTLFPTLTEIILLDINALALEFAGANIALNAIATARTLQSDILSAWEGGADLIIANPPYLIDPGQRAYRHGGGHWGADLAVRILDQALQRLNPGGHLLLYTGSAVVDGEDQFLKAVLPILRQRTVQYRYEETDPDVFGEELENAPYDRADRIATVLLNVRGSDIQR